MQQPPRHHDLLRRALGIKGPVTKPLPHDDDEWQALIWPWLTAASQAGEHESSSPEDGEV